MTPSTDNSALIARFAARYRQAHSPVIQRIERSAFSCAYGATSWTTRDEAETMANLLALAPGTRALEVGTGSGWPGLYLASLSGCEFALIDLPFDGLRVAADRAAADGMSDRCWPVVADGAALPLATDRFDAVIHSDVLCCLEAKLAALQECRRVVRDTGKMVFSVLSTAPDLSADDYQRAIALGPKFVTAAADYPSLVHQAGWHVTRSDDITAAFIATVRKLRDQEEAHADELIAVVGAAPYADRLATMRDRLQGAELGLIRRELITATAN